MSLAIAIVVAVLFLDAPWNVLLVLGAVVWEALEIVLFLRWRNRKALMGAETLVGMRGPVVNACRPEGQARIKGHFWKVNCPEGAEVGEMVEVIRTEGLLLHVRVASPSEPVEAAGPGP